MFWPHFSLTPSNSPKMRRILLDCAFLCEKENHFILFEHYIGSGKSIGCCYQRRHHDRRKGDAKQKVTDRS